MAKNLSESLEPIREKREYYEANPDHVDGIIDDGILRARKVAAKTMDEVRASVKI
jgi:tryptophanyl-tRNA synthetase